MSESDKYGLPVETEFMFNEIGIDPEGCGCTDCIVGNSIPLDDEARIQSLALAVAEGARTALNRTGSDLVLVENRATGTYSFTTVPGSRVISVLRPN